MRKSKIAITTGDPLGIGEEITYKALKAIKPDSERIIIIGKNLGLGYETIELEPSDTGKYCYDSLKIACDMAVHHQIQGIVTSPVSKEQLNKSGYHYSGQTEILEKLLSKNEDEKAEMLFIARDLRVMLLTRHIPLKDVKLTEDMIISKTLRLNKFLKEKCHILYPKIALCALNPHAGENGILGHEEIDVIIPSVKKLNKLGVFAYGPYSADGLFSNIGKNYLSSKKQEYDAVISMYHDQGLCPIKALTGNNAVNTTIGLNVIRTSPSSGTAYDIKGKNIADASGMQSAVELLLKLI